MGMTIREVIHYIDQLYPNTIDNATKCGWIAQCEARIWDDVMLLPPEACLHYVWDYDADRPLLMPAPHDEIYRSYLLARMYDFYHEADGYQNTMEMHNRQYRQLAVWYADRYEPAKGGRMPIPVVPEVVAGESVTMEFTLPYEREYIAQLRVAMYSGGQTTVYTQNDLSFDGMTARLEISQEASLALPVGTARIMLAGTDINGTRFESRSAMYLRIIATGYGDIL